MAATDFCITIVSSLFPSRVDTALEGLVAAGVLVLIGIVIIMTVGALLFFLPAAVVAWIVWFLTGSELYAAAAFLIIALLSLTKKK
jgi:hypothetical protein